jgi:hypothetical protein
VGLVGGPPGALGGAAAGWAAGEGLLAVGRAVVQRLDNRGAMQVGGAIAVIESDAQERRERGESPGDDAFFDSRGEMRPEAEELLEGVLLHAANTYEERKLPFLAHLYDGVAHDANVAAADALYLVRAADQLTYRQLAGLAVFARVDAYVMDLARAQAARDEGAQLDAHRLRVYVNEHVAHDMAEPTLAEMPTYADLHAAIDSVGEIFKKYAVTLTGGWWATLEPAIQGDWKAIFRVPWLPS